MEEENSGLIHLPSIQEVKDAKFSIPADSSSGSNGFGFGFYRSCWDIVEGNVVEAVRDLFVGPLCHGFIQLSILFLSRKCNILLGL